MMVDQVTKKIAVARLEGHEPRFIFGGSIKLVLVKNRGAAMGFLRSRPLLLKILNSLLLAAVLFYLFFQASENYGSVPVCLSLICGGAAGNLLDRFRRGFVIDFFCPNIKHSPVFNLADVFIITGGIFIAVQALAV